MPNKWGEGERLREEILYAAGRLLARSRSEENLSLRAVAREAGIAAPSIYRHFRDKSEIVWEVLAVAYGELAEAMRAAADGAETDDPRAALTAMTDAYCRFAVERPHHYHLMFSMEQAEVAADRLPEHPVNQVLELFTASVARYTAIYPHARLDAGQLAVLLWTALHGHASLRKTFPLPPDVASHAAMHENLLTELLGPRS